MNNVSRILDRLSKKERKKSFGILGLMDKYLEDSIIPKSI